MKNNDKCVICELDITPDPNGWKGGHNARPVKEGQCCYYCNNNVVTPVRLVQFGIMKGAE